MRLSFIQKVYAKDSLFHSHGIYDDDIDIERAIKGFSTSISNAYSINELLLSEAKFTKSLYKIACQKIKLNHFTRDRDAEDIINQNLNHGNYLAYGLASLSLWALGIPPVFALMHGKTRRGALVFDVADIVKDAVVLPWAFICAKERMTDQEFRQQCLLNFTKHKVLDFMFNSVKESCQLGSVL